MKPPSELSPAELTRAIAKVDAESSAICSEFIAAGRGYEKPTETRLLSDPLALRWKACATKGAELRAEWDRRMIYSGTLKRIRAIDA